MSPLPPGEPSLPGMSKSCANGFASVAKLGLGTRAFDFGHDPSARGQAWPAQAGGTIDAEGSARR